MKEKKYLSEHYAISLGRTFNKGLKVQIVAVEEWDDNSIHYACVHNSTLLWCTENELEFEKNPKYLLNSFKGQDDYDYITAGSK